MKKGSLTMGGTRVKALPVLGRDVATGDTILGHVVAEVLSPGRLRIDDDARTVLHVGPGDRLVVRRAAPVRAAERADCPFCGKSVAMVAKGKAGETVSMIFLPHGPKGDPCDGSRLTASEAGEKHAAQVAERSSA